MAEKLSSKIYQLPNEGKVTSPDFEYEFFDNEENFKVEDGVKVDRETAAKIEDIKKINLVQGGIRRILEAKAA